MLWQEDLAPRAVWEHFYQLTQIPRPSHHEERISAYLAGFGRALGLETAVNEVGNVLIRKPASAGMDDRPGVILQAHMDMVPEKAPEKVHDFESDPITAFVEEGWLRTDGTTLGADDGIGVALIMTLLRDDTLTHGPLEALFTVNEEDGFTGADAVTPGVLQGSLLINVDSEVEGTITIGSAGGADVDVTGRYAEEPTPAGLTGLRLQITGLPGGHSGIDIDRGRGNAIKLLARLLWSAQQEIGLRVASIESGGRYNAIPREAAAVVAVPETEALRLTRWIETFAATVRQELARTEPDLQIVATPVEIPAAVMAPDAQRRIVGALYTCPNGVMRMSDSVSGLVETSTNLGLAAAADGMFTAGFLVRSAVNSARDDVEQMARCVFDLAGFEAVRKDAFTGWKPNPDSPLLALMQSIYRDLWGHDAEVVAVHAGLETSEFGAAEPGLDMISVGPTMEHVHSPDERLEIASVAKVYDLLVATLQRIPANHSGTASPTERTPGRSSGLVTT
jgi:dipeptidase D